MVNSDMYNFHDKNNEETVNDAKLDEYSEALIGAIQDGATLKDIYGISDGTMRDMYKLAYEFYNQGKLNDAESLFKFLCVYDFYNPEYAMGLAAVNHLKKNYEKAINFYALAYSLAKSDFRPMFYAGQCNLMLRRHLQAKKCFEIVIERSNDKELSEKAQAYLSALLELDTLTS